MLPVAFIEFTIAPNGKYITFTAKRTMYASPYTVILDTPDLDNFLKVSNLRERYDMWKEIELGEDIAMLWDPMQYGGFLDFKLYAANDRLFMIANGSIVNIIEISEKKGNIMLRDYKLVKGEEFVKWAKVTTNGDYLLYVNCNHSNDKCFLNILNVENKSITRELQAYPKMKHTYFTSSYDGSKFLSITRKRITMFEIS